MLIECREDARKAYTYLKFKQSCFTISLSLRPDVKDACFYVFMYLFQKLVSMSLYILTLSDLSWFFLMLRNMARKYHTPYFNSGSNEYSTKIAQRQR